MILTPSLRKFALTAHVTVSVGWVGALAVFLAHAIASLTANDAMVVRAACIAMGLTAWFVILPLSVASLVTGLVQGLGTAWGLFRHYWVVAKLLLTTVATVVLLLKLAPISTLADAATKATFAGSDLVGLRMSPLVHAAGGLLVLLTVAILAIYKPAGLTRFGARKEREGGLAAAAGTPRWVKAFTLAAVVLILSIIITLHAGGHGPGAHFSSS